MSTLSLSSGYPLGMGYMADKQAAPVYGDVGSKVMQQDMALPVPLGSQLNLLNAATAGNKYLNWAAKSTPRLSEQQRSQLMDVPYSMGAGNGDTSYLQFKSAYGK